MSPRARRLHRNRTRPKPITVIRIFGPFTDTEQSILTEEGFEFSVTTFTFQAPATAKRERVLQAMAVARRITTPPRGAHNLPGGYMKGAGMQSQASSMSMAGMSQSFIPAPAPFCNVRLDTK